MNIVSSSSSFLFLVFVAFSAMSASTTTVVNAQAEGSCPTDWPDVVGQTGTQAKAEIESSCVDGGEILDVQIVKDGGMVTMDYRTDRVRVWVDGNGVVVRAPIVG